MSAIVKFIKRETVLCIAFAAALISMIFVPPNADYLGYVDWSTLGLLFCLMAAVQGFGSIGRIPEAVRSAYAAIPEYPDARSGSVADVLFPRHAGDQRRFADNTCSADDNTVPMPPGGYDPHGGPGNRRCQPRLHDHADGESAESVHLFPLSDAPRGILPYHATSDSDKPCDHRAVGAAYPIAGT